MISHLKLGQLVGLYLPRGEHKTWAYDSNGKEHYGTDHIWSTASAPVVYAVSRWQN
jgi:hypothetical protein